jgi:hypothetical protein
MNGIGGKTIDEAKENLSKKEALDWRTYQLRHGSLNPAYHIEKGFAALTALIINRTGGRARVDDFRPYFVYDDTDEEGEATLGDFMKVLYGARVHGK